MSQERALRLLMRWEYPGADGITLRGWRTRPTGRPVLHFTHGNGLCALAYTPFLQHLQHNYDLFLYDIQGHGDSDEGTQFLGWEHNADLLQGAWQAHAALYASVPSIAVGHSLGGVMTLLRAARNPGTFSRLCLLDPILISPKVILLSRLGDKLGYRVKLPLAEQARRRRNVWTSHAQAEAFFKRRGMFASWDEGALRAYVQHGLQAFGDQFKLKCPPWLEAEIFNSLPHSLWSAAKRLNTPCTILYGQNTSADLRAQYQLAHRKNTHITLAPIAGSHFFVQEHPKETATAVTEHLNGDPRAIASSF